MTATSRRKLARRELRVPWMLRPRLILLANVVAFIVNIGAVLAGSGQDSKLTNICATVDKPSTITVPASGLATAAAIAAIVIAAACILLTVAWCIRGRSASGRMGPVIGTAFWLVVFALVNILIACIFGLNSGGSATCSGGV